MGENNNDLKGLNSLVKVGFIHHPHGIKGEVFIQPLSENPEWATVEKIRSFYLGPRGELPGEFSVKSIRSHKKGLLVFFHEVFDRDGAERVNKWQVYLPKEFFSSRRGEEFYLMEIKDFSVKERDGGLIGTVKGFSSNGLQDLLIVEKVEGKEVLIPYVDEFIIRVEFEKKILLVDLPEGLLEV